MPMQRISYDEARRRVRPGDLVAFGGSGWVSQIIRLSMGAPVSHTGVILTALGADGREPQLVESSIQRRDGRLQLGVQPSGFGSAWNGYQGRAWLLPLRDDVRARFDAAEFDRFLRGMQGMPFDLPGGAGVLLKEMWDQLRELLFGPQAEAFLSRNHELQFFFCSELIAAAFETAKLTQGVRAADVSPIDLCRWNLYEATYFQREGDEAAEIPDFGKRKPGSTSVDEDRP